MTDLEIDELVERIGDEILGRLGVPGAAKPAPSCACSHPLESAAQSSAPSASLEQRLIGTLHCPAATPSEVEKLCAEAKKRRYSAVCVSTSRVATAVRALEGSGIPTAVTAGYPDGSSITPVKLAEVEAALTLGCRVSALVVNTGAVRAGELDVVFAELRSAAEAAHRAGAEFIAVLEPALLGREEQLTAAALARLAGADGVAAGTGRRSHQTTTADEIRLLRAAVGDEAEVVASGGIASLDQAAVLHAAGADRIAVEADVLGSSW